MYNMIFKYEHCEIIATLKKEKHIKHPFVCGKYT